MGLKLKSASQPVFNYWEHEREREGESQKEMVMWRATGVLRRYGAAGNKVIDPYITNLFVSLYICVSYDYWV